MSQATYITDPTRTRAQARSFFSAVLQAIASNNSGATAPAETYPHMFWADTATATLKQRNAANSGWITIGSFDQAAGTFTPAGLAQLSEAQAADDTSQVFGQVSGQRLAQAVAAHAPAAPIEAWHPYDMVSPGDGAGGVIYDHATDGTVLSVETPSFEDGYEYAVKVEALSHNHSIATPLLIEAWLETTGAYSGIRMETGAPSSSVLLYGSAQFVLPREIGFVHRIAQLSNGFSGGGGAWTAAEADVTHPAAQKIGRGRVRFAAGSIDAGRITLLRRREYVTG
ncbi:hypothetical protein SAMN05444722_1679 [Rhodovulum sp. ES.010]|uniref:hypothetical protein n=1 Tax=Rhodovulum sp. ES.010 TaxID=1882821 RepID=UPI000929B338|nr:hypothetical protein [Rhodovulum sp. ES.010]SIO36317.1 hypothetical protein SAMN05444722_1679 [Rhodovulum sp. ES.010]